MTDAEKIYVWCDRQCKETNKSHCLVVCRNRPQSPLVRTPWYPWIAVVKEWSDDRGDWESFASIYIPFRAFGSGLTPEEAIASLAKALGL